MRSISTVDTDSGEIHDVAPNGLAEGEFTRTALLLPEHLPYEEWQAKGETLQQIGGAWKWWLGDWLNYGERKYGETYAQGIEQTNLDYQTLQDAAWVARNVELSLRNENLSWSHHREVASLDPPQQQEWLDRAESEGWAVRDLRQELKNQHNDGDEWYTPKWLFDALGLAFSIDVCSPADRTHTNVPAERWFTRDDDGLAQPWAGLVWCNPPYSTPGPWAERCVQHDNGLLLTHVPMNANWCMSVWNTCGGIRLFQGMEFVRPDGTSQRPGYWLQLAAFGEEAVEALARLEAPNEVAENPRRVPSPLWVPA